MPLTIAHPAAAVPLRRVMGKYGNLSALIIGSLTPDFAYFLPIGVTRSESHSVTGLVWFCIPTGLVAWWTFHALLKRPLIFLAPQYIQRRVANFAEEQLQPLKVEALVPVVLSLAIGALTHIAWDAFTHARGPAVEWAPSLRTSILSLGGQNLRIYKVLQHMSTAVGVALLWFWSWRWLQRAPLRAGPPFCS